MSATDIVFSATTQSNPPNPRQVRHSQWASEIIKEAYKQAADRGETLSESHINAYLDARCSGMGHIAALGKACAGPNDADVRVFRECMKGGFTAWQESGE